MQCNWFSDGHPLTSEDPFHCTRQCCFSFVLFFFWKGFILSWLLLLTFSDLRVLLRCTCAEKCEARSRHEPTRLFPDVLKIDFIVCSKIKLNKEKRWIESFCRCLVNLCRSSLRSNFTVHLVSGTHSSISKIKKSLVFGILDWRSFFVQPALGFFMYIFNWSRILWSKMSLQVNIVLACAVLTAKRPSRATHRSPLVLFATDSLTRFSHKIHLVNSEKTHFVSFAVKVQCHDIQWYFALFCAGKKWRQLAQVSRTSDHDSSVSRANSFNVQAESRKCRFPRAIVVFFALPSGRHYFSHTKWLPKITDYRDTAALRSGQPRKCQLQKKTQVVYCCVLLYPSDCCSFSVPSCKDETRQERNRPDDCRRSLSEGITFPADGGSQFDHWHSCQGRTWLWWTVGRSALRNGLQLEKANVHRGENQGVKLRVNFSYLLPCSQT